jgi:hypothetical protein
MFHQTTVKHLQDTKLRRLIKKKIRNIQFLLMIYIRMKKLIQIILLKYYNLIKAPQFNQVIIMIVEV